MSTILYPSPIVGPIHSRRLGISLGVNVNPSDEKICTFDCIYCEVGYNRNHHTSSPRPTRLQIATELESKLKEMKANGSALDVITFSGNGEPTGHPYFLGIVEDTIRLRNDYYPDAKVSVLTNSTLAVRPDVHCALMLVDNNIMKLDTVDPIYINNVDRPVSSAYDVEQIIKEMQSFNGHVIIQTIFMNGTDDLGRDVSNTSDRFVEPWLAAVRQIRPSEVMIYTIDRETPCPTLRKATHEELNTIRDRVAAEGFNCIAAY
ncbi:radical SAM protein [Prevotella sp.]|uniref:radical SAM protein n=1 Tax=Prevotella sp. TaxID=59823 RepID=UPI0025D93F46|nr:radical SAM protein [Prevotella sp.]